MIEQLMTEMSKKNNEINPKLEKRLKEEMPEPKPLSEIDKKIDDKLESDEKLSTEQKEGIKERTGFSSVIVDAIHSFKELEIYQKAGLKESVVNDKPCLIKTDIDFSKKDELGRTNKQRMESGLAPLDKEGKAIELHHIGQRKDSPLAELTQSEHRGKGNDGVLHDKNKESEIDRTDFNTERQNYWKERARMG